MSSIAWKDSLKAVFKEFASFNDVPPEEFLDLLREGKIVVGESSERNFQELAPKEKEEVIRDFWNLAHQDELLPEERLALYARMADRYERFFEWEEERFPGW